MHLFSRRVIILLLAISTGAIIILGATFISHAPERVFPGVTVQGINLEGMDRRECLAELHNLEREMTSASVLLSCKDRHWKLPLQEIDLRLDAEAIADAALNVGRKGSLFQRWQHRQLVKKNGYAVPLKIIINREKFNRKLDELTAEIGFPPQDAIFKINKDERIEVIPGQDGMGVDKEAAYQKLVSALTSREEAFKIELNLIKVKPRRTTEEVLAMGLKGLLSSYSTSFDSSNTDRTYNIRVAASALDGLLVPPGQEVSFNKIVGPRSSEAGYKNAKVIINNELVDGIGGGVCQVSTTLYNALLLANLKIIERTNHSLPVPYVPIGRDATVVYDSIDLKFCNNTESYLYIRSSVAGGRLSFKIYGNTDYRIPLEIRTKIVKVFEPKTIYEKDPNLRKGEEVVKQEGSKGYQVLTERVIWEGKKALVETLPESIYQPINKVVAVGIKAEEELPVILPPGTEEKKSPPEKIVPDNKPAEVGGAVYN